MAGLFAAQHGPSPGPTVQLVYKAAPESASREPEAGAPPSDPSLLQGLSEDVQVIRSRLDHLGIRGATVRAAGNQILVGLPTLPANQAIVVPLQALKGQTVYEVKVNGQLTDAKGVSKPFGTQFTFKTGISPSIPTSST